MTEEEMIPVWREKYEKMGVTLHELYLRQTGGCKLVVINSVLHCTDGKDTAETSKMLNPTFECMQCVSRFTEKVFTDAVKNNEQGTGEDHSGSNP